MPEKLPIVEEALRKAGGLYIEYLKDELDYQKHVASGKLKNGFYVRVHYAGGGIRMDVMNKYAYMDIVNNGASGVTASFAELDAWTSQKEARGELSFSSRSRRNYFIQKVKTELEQKYLTVGGDKVAPRRYFFIETAYDTANAQGVEDTITDGVSNEIEAILNKYGTYKAIQLTI